MSLTCCKKTDKLSLKLSENNTIRLIQLYQGEPSLYDASWGDYRNRILRAEALKRICAALSVDGFGPKEVATKFKNLRNSYSQELKKIQDSEKSGKGPENLYVPKVYWFELMDSFLRPQMYTRSSRSSISLEQTSNTKDNHVLPESVATQAIKIENEEDSTSIFYDSVNEQLYLKEEETEAPDPKKLKATKDWNNSPQLDNCSSENSSFSNMASSNDSVRRKMYSRQKKSAAAGRFARKNKPSSGMFRSQDRPVGTTAALGRLCEISEMSTDMYGNFGQFVAGVLREAGGRKAIVMTSEITGVLMRHMTEPSAAIAEPASPTDSDLSSNLSEPS